MVAKDKIVFCRMREKTVRVGQHKRIVEDYAQL